MSRTLNIAQADAFRGMEDALVEFVMYRIAGSIALDSDITFMQADTAGQPAGLFRTHAQACRSHRARTAVLAAKIIPLVIRLDPTATVSEVIAALLSAATVTAENDGLTTAEVATVLPWHGRPDRTI